MSDINQPDPIIQAAAGALYVVHGWEPEGPPRYYRDDHRRDAEVIVAAVRPLIEAEALRKAAAIPQPLTQSDLRTLAEAAERGDF